MRTKLPTIEIKTTKQATLSLPQELVEEIIKEWLQANCADMKDTQINVAIECDGHFECIAVGTRESIR